MIRFHPDFILTQEESTKDEHDIVYLRQAITSAQRSRTNGNHPFGALLVDEQDTGLLEAENTVVTDNN